MGKRLNFLSPFGIPEIHDFLSFQFILKLSYLKPFHNTLNYASTANIEEVMKFYNLGDKTFETDFNPKQVGLFADWYGRGRAHSAPPL